MASTRKVEILKIEYFQHESLNVSAVKLSLHDR